MKKFKLQVWKSHYYGITIILMGKHSGRRLLGAKLWAGQTPSPILLQEFEVSKTELIKDIQAA
jgi:hypothetical protein